jgi:REP element-mobilizing transposase RayT
MRRTPAQAVLPFSRKERVLNRQIRQRAGGERVTRGPGRPRKKNNDRMPHTTRPALAEQSAVHVTLRVRERVPNLRARRRFNVIKQAFVSFAAGRGFRLVHFAVLSNHVHFVVEANGQRALSKGMQKLLHSISRRLNALSLKEHGSRQSTKAGPYSALKGWLGRVFSDRYHAHVLKTPTEMEHAVQYVLQNASRHYGSTATRPAGLSRGKTDPCSSAAVPELVCDAKGFLLARACRRILARLSEP